MVSFATFNQNTPVRLIVELCLGTVRKKDKNTHFTKLMVQRIAHLMALVHLMYERVVGT